MPFGLPRSLWWFVATGIVFLLQWFPVTGIFLMFAFGAFWSVILVNVGFVSLALEALLRPGYRLWLLAPVLYFGGYALAASLSHEEFARLDAEIRAQNAKVAVSAPKFDADRFALVIDKRSYRSGSIAPALVYTFDLDVAFESNLNRKTANHTGYWLAHDDVCRTVRQDRNARAAFVHASRMRGKRSVPGVCRLSGPADPSLPAVTVSLQETKTQSWLLPLTRHTLSIAYPDGRTVILESAYGAPLRWVPMPGIGCALNSGAPAWQCFAVFLRERKKGLGGEGAYGRSNAEIVGAALGLTKQTLAVRSVQAITRLPSALRDAMQTRLDISLANLERILRDPTERLTVHDLRGLHQRIDLWRQRVPEILDALERAFDGGAKTRERATMLQALLLKLDNDAYRVPNRQLLDALVSRPDLSKRFIQGETLTRLGDLGASAVPVLERYLSVRGRVDPAVMLGICRTGRDGFRHSDLLVRRAEQLKGGQRRERFAAYMTLHRIGAGERARSALGDKHRISEDLLRHVAATVGPDSEPNVCMRYGKWLNRHRRVQRSKI